MRSTPDTRALRTSRAGSSTVDTPSGCWSVTTSTCRSPLDLDAVLAERPGLEETAIVFDPVATLGDYMAQVVDLDAVVASRRTTSCAQRGVPTIAVGYGDKHRC